MPHDLAGAERAALADLLDDVGPDVPTLCAGWTTRDLAAHLVVRERRPDALPGLGFPPLAGWTARVQGGVAATPWPDLVQRIRTGPPRWSPFRLPPVARAANGVEFTVHHEDVRRGRPGWEPRPADGDRDGEVWARLQGAARLAHRRSPVGVVLRRPDGATIPARRGARTVTVEGEPVELLLHAFGRRAHRCSFEGEPADVAALEAAPRGG